MHQIKNTKTGRFEKKHGMSKTKIYHVWLSMRERCSKKSNKSYKNYGEKGIKVCKEWDDNFMVFYDFAISNGYKDGLTIDRINSNKGYEPSNCRFITTKEQNRNYSRNHMITYNNETLCLSDMADKYGISRSTVLFRIKSGKELDEVFSKEDKRFKKNNLIK
jgi:hypothetical protein